MERNLKLLSRTLNSFVPDKSIVGSRAEYFAVAAETKEKQLINMHSAFVKRLQT